MNQGERRKLLAIMKENCLHAYLATCDGEQPRVRPVSPIVEDDLSIWITTYSSSRKVEQIRENPRICLAFVEQPRGDKTATVIGEAEIVPGLEEKKRVWKLASFDLAEHFPKGPESTEFCLLRINVKKIEWRERWTNKVNTYEPERK